MNKDRWGVHERHCCALHGCKYGDDDCPVENGLTKQEYTCEYCNEEGFKSLEDIEEYNYWKNKVKEHEGKDFMSVSVSFLAKLFDKS